MMLVQDFGDDSSGNMANEKWWRIELPSEIRTQTFDRAESGEWLTDFLALTYHIPFMFWQLL